MKKSDLISTILSVVFIILIGASLMSRRSTSTTDGKPSPQMQQRINTYLVGEVCYRSTTAESQDLTAYCQELQEQYKMEFLCETNGDCRVEVKQ